MALTNILRNFVVFVDGYGKIGDGAECNLPKIESKVEEFHGGGMWRPKEVVLGGEKLEASFKLTSFDPQVITKVGLFAGSTHSFVFRGSLSSEDGTTNRVIARMLAVIKSDDPGTWQAGEKIEHEFQLAVSRYKLTHGDSVLIEIDVENFIEKRNGVDILREDRINLGL